MLFPLLKQGTESVARHSPVIALLLLVSVAVVVAIRYLKNVMPHRPATAPCIEKIGPYVLKERLGSGGRGEV